MFGTLITHRGIDIPFGKTAAECPMESTWEAFTAQLDAGFGLEFDIQPTADGGFAISHDKNLARLTGGQSAIDLKDLPTSKISSIKVPGGRLCTLDELLAYMAEHAVAISALHLKASCQTAEVLDTLIAHLKPFETRLSERLMIFDATITTATVLRQQLPGIALAASVSDKFDVVRYGEFTGGTLLTMEEVLQFASLYSWVWLDEWDRAAENGQRKTIVSAATVAIFHQAGFNVAVVSPELHATSPSLLGGEAHEDGSDAEKLRLRWESWKAIGLDAVCTDHASILRVFR